ncbi:MAG TPA: restriction endonuclease subunit S [Pyrinomonadaceae bacterium]|jgi:type I restriction enzyme S subunit
MKLGWDKRPFLDVFEDKSGGNIKTPQSEYLKEGAFPIVDQGKSLIGGYTNDSERVCKTKPPVIIFGDHTRCFKYVDFPFAMGADGVKVLKPKINVDAKYLFRYLNTLRLPDAGYDRHFKYLKRIQITYPIDPDEQRRIVAVLDKADIIREKRRQAIKKINMLLQAIFLDTFGDPVKNPNGWDVQPLSELMRFRTGKLDANAAVAGGAYPFFTCSREDSQIDTYAFDCEALLLAGNNATADYSVKHYKGKFNAYQRTYVITLLNPKHSYSYMRYALEKKLQDMKRLSKGTNTKYLTLSILQNLKIQVPSPEKQKEFEAVSLKISDHLKKHDNSLHLLDDLFHSIQQRAFSGELFNGKATAAALQHRASTASQTELFD